MDNLARLAAFKRGDTFVLAARYKLDGAPASLTGLTLRAQVRGQDDALLADLVVDVWDEAADPDFLGRFTLSAQPEITATWPAPGTAWLDIEITDAGRVRSSQTVLLPIDRDITREA